MLYIYPLIAFFFVVLLKKKKRFGRLPIKRVVVFSVKTPFLEYSALEFSCCFSAVRQLLLLMYTLSLPFFCFWHDLACKPLYALHIPSFLLLVSVCAASPYFFGSCHRLLVSSFPCFQKPSALSWKETCSSQHSD